MKQKRVVFTFNYLLMAATRAMARVQASEAVPEDTLVDRINAVLYCALTLEAFLNHVGAESMPLWRPLKRKLSPLEKLEVLAAHHKIHISWDSAPYQSFAAAMMFRNLIVHAETETVEGAVTSPYDQVIPKWQTLCTASQSRRILADTKRILEDLPAQMGLTAIPAFTLAIRTQ
jgi:hypothetical protein